MKLITTMSPEKEISLRKECNKLLGKKATDEQFLKFLEMRKQAMLAFLDQF